MQDACLPGLGHRCGRQSGCLPAGIGPPLWQAVWVLDLPFTVYRLLFTVFRLLLLFTVYCLLFTCPLSLFINCFIMVINGGTNDTAIIPSTTIEKFSLTKGMLPKKNQARIKIFTQMRFPSMQNSRNLEYFIVPTPATNGANVLIM